MPRKANMENQNLTQAQEGPKLPQKRVDIDPSYPQGGTLIKIEKGDILKGAGDQRVTKEQAAILCAPVDPKSVRILPDTASLYLPWSWYADRLTKAFGPMGWALLPVTDHENNPKPAVCRDNVMYREYTLKADGRFVASAMGECGYREGNERMTFGDAVEGARSNALSRCCKGLGMAPEVHDEGWREDWTKEYAIAVHCTTFKGPKTYWRRASGIPLKGEQGHANPPCPCQTCATGAPSNAKDGKPILRAPTTSKPVVEAQGEPKVDAHGLKALKAIMTRYKITPDAFLALVEGEIGHTLPNGSTDLLESECNKIKEAFANVETGAYSLKDGKLVKPPL